MLNEALSWCERFIVLVIIFWQSLSFLYHRYGYYTLFVPEWGVVNCRVEVIVLSRRDSLHVVVVYFHFHDQWISSPVHHLFPQLPKWRRVTFEQEFLSYLVYGYYLTVIKTRKSRTILINSQAYLQHLMQYSLHLRHIISTVN